jgi:hypothetical protein
MNYQHHHHHHLMKKKLIKLIIIIIIIIIIINNNSKNNSNKRSDNNNNNNNNINNNNNNNNPLITHNNILSSDLDSSNNNFMDPICWALIESISALNEVQEIVQVEGIDGIYVGRFDLALSMSISPQEIENDKTLNKQIESILKHAKAGGLPTGTSGEFSKLLDQGFRILTVRSELELLSAGLQKYLKD